MRDFLQALFCTAVNGGIVHVIDGLPVLCVAADQGRNGTDDSSAHQDEAEDLLDHGCCRQAAHVQREQQQGANHADDDGGQIDTTISHLVKGLAVFQAGDQITQNVGDLDGFPRDDRHECAEGRPAGDDGHVLVKRTEGKCHAAAGDGQGGDQFAVAQCDGDHHHQCHDVADTSGDRAAAAGHPAVDGDGPADSDDCAKTNAEKVNCAYAFFLSLITHTFYLVSC